MEAGKPDLEIRLGKTAVEMPAGKLDLEIRLGKTVVEMPVGKTDVEMHNGDGDANVRKLPLGKTELQLRTVTRGTATAKRMLLGKLHR